LDFVFLPSELEVWGDNRAEFIDLHDRPQKSSFASANNSQPKSSLKFNVHPFTHAPMTAPLICYILIGPPGSGKTTLAAKIRQQNPQYQIISTDQIRTQLLGNPANQENWPIIEAEVLSQIQQAITANHPIIYDATNSKRPHRIDLLQKLSHHPVYWVALHLQTTPDQCRKWNQQRNRQVPDAIIDDMAKSLKTFPASQAEGFTAVEEIKPLDDTLNLTTAHKAYISSTNSLNRRKNYEFHRYSRLQDFEQLMHLLALIIAHPGIGNLQQTAPATLETILGTLPTFESDIAEISAFMAKQHSPLYANPHTLQRDLDFLEHNGFFHCDRPLPDLQLDKIPDEISTILPFAHCYSDKDVFKRVLKTILWLAHNSLLREETKIQDNLFQNLCEQNIYHTTEYDTFRKDIQLVLKPYKILPPIAMKKGYFLGTGIFSKPELRNLFKVVKSLEKSIEDPISAEICNTFSARIANSSIFGTEETETFYPVRAIANQVVMECDHNTEGADYKKLRDLENAIENGELLELQTIKGAASYSKQQERKQAYSVYPLQIVFHNIGWYLGYERILPNQESLLEFARLDRIYIARKLNKSRSRLKQLKVLKSLKKLYTSSPSIYLGDSPEDQKNYLSRDPQKRKMVEVEIELWITDEAFDFISEEDKRFPQSQMKMSKPRLKDQFILAKEVFTESPSKDPQHPNLFIVTLPKWALDDIDFKRWIVSFGPEIKVIRPLIFLEKIRDFHKNAFAIYNA
jgi:predicted kinase